MNHCDVTLFIACVALMSAIAAVVFAVIAGRAK